MITTIIQSYRRQANIPIIIKALREQTIKPSRIIVWNDNDGSGKDLRNLGKDVEIINTNTNHNGNYGSFLFCYLADTKYIAVIDDDYPPAKNWFKFCIDNIKPKTIFGRYGIILRDNGYYNRLPLICKVGKEIKFTKVDMVGHSYFFQKEAVLPMFSVRPPTWHNNVDLHFSFLAIKNGWNLYVPTVKVSDQLPYNSNIKLPFTENDNPMYAQKGHLKKRDEYVKWAIKNKIR